MIPDDVINQILDRVDIVDVIAGYIPLRRAGRNFRANCPFHHEKTPSFMVSPDKQIFHCFGCGIGGNVFGFLMKYERLEFPEAVELMAQKVGVQLPKWSVSPGERSEAAKVYSANEAALNFYHYVLLETEHSKDARAYLEKRGISADCVRRLKLGYAPPEWDAFSIHARKKGLDNKTLEKAGLVLSGRDGGFYDRFRHRVIFPIFNQKGQVVGFGARVLDETLPKYINSPETPVYNKGSHLYGLNLATEHIKQKDFVIIVEGYLDFLTPHQAGIGNIVASLGTALTIEQIRLLKRFTKNITMVFDPDSAGEAASLRGLDLSVSEGLNVRVATLPEGYDPDRFVREKGADNFLEIINNAADFFDYKYRLLKARFSAGDADSKAKIAGEMLQTIARVPNAIIKTEYVKRLAENLDVQPQAVWEEIKKVRLDRQVDIGLDFSTPASGSGVSCLNAAEKMLLGLALQEPQLIKQIRDYFRSNAIDEGHGFKSLLDVVCEFWNKNKTTNIAKLINFVKDEAHCKEILDAYAMAQDISDRDKCLKDCIRNIRQIYIKDRMKHLQNQIKTAQTTKDEGSLGKLLSEYNSLIRQKVGV